MISERGDYLSLASLLNVIAIHSGKCLINSFQKLFAKYFQQLSIEPEASNTPIKVDV